MTDLCHKCKLRFKWIQSLKGLCYWCETKKDEHRVSPLVPSPVKKVSKR